MPLGFGVDAGERGLEDGDAIPVGLGVEGMPPFGSTKSSRSTVMHVAKRKGHEGCVSGVSE